MPNVHILPPDLISKIAAGEVIERPASVVKELIENSLDAKTDMIDLHLEDAGRTLIRLRDTGTGISREDMEQLFQRHATSKIQNFDDLFNIHSLGFRGEALYSVAAIADVILRSKDRAALDTASGWETHLRGGQRLELKPCAIPQGTEIEVKELFFNTPARRKFLKSNLSEINQVVQLFTPYTLLYPQCRFVLTHGDKTLMELAPTADRRERIAAVLGLETKHLLEVEQIFATAKITVRMVLGDMNIVRGRRDLQFLFVNGRPVQNKSIGFHLNEAYRLILPPQNFPFFYLNLELPAEDVDVNIHPTKREVKIKNEQHICSLLRQLTEQTLMGCGSAKQAQNANSQEPIKPTLLRPSETPAAFERHSEITDSAFEHAPTTRPTTEYTYPQSPSNTSISDAIQATENLFGTSLLPADRAESLQNQLNKATFIGIFANKFLLFESGKNLLLIDQHAAQERITFEHLIQQMDKGRVEVQQLLSPILVRLSAMEMLVWEEAQSIFAELGFAATPFDKETLGLHSYPALIKNPERAFRDILAGENPARCDHEALARRACRGSVMAGDPLDATRARYIREALLLCRDPFTCPHGRPTTIELSENFLNKQFLRT